MNSASMLLPAAMSEQELPYVQICDMPTPMCSTRGKSSSTWMRRLESSMAGNLLVALFMVELFICSVCSLPVDPSSTSGGAYSLLRSPDHSFAVVYRLPDGERVTKLKWKNFTAIETRYAKIDLIQILKLDSVIQLWLSNGELVDCESTRNETKLEKIKLEFFKVHPNLQNENTRSLKLLEEYQNMTELPQHLKRLTEYERFEQQCSQLHSKIKNYYQRFNFRKGKLTRAKRALTFPGTKWCGKGSNSQTFEDLGDYSFADRCCRDHDRCKYSIGPNEKKFHLKNSGFHYVSHCSCDERFRSCLKVADSGAANLVGKIYFNVVATKCFMFEMGDICDPQDQSWWGNGCEKPKRAKRAIYRDPVPY